MNTTSGARIRRLRLTNYRSVASCDLALGDLAVLVGPNGAGKSNVLDALVFLKQALSTGLGEAIDDRGADQIAYRASRELQAPRVEVEVEIEGLPGGGSGTYSVSFTVTPTIAPVITVHSEKCAVRTADGAHCAGFSTKAGMAEVDGMRIPVPAIEGSSLILGALAGYDHFAAVRRALVSTTVSAPRPDAMRLVTHHGVGKGLEREAGNLAAVLLWLQQEMPEIKDRVEDYQRLIVPGLQTVSPREAGGAYVLDFELGSQGPDDAFPLLAGVMSDGTLRALGILTALFAPQGDGVLGPVVVEEPETALHPAAAGILFDVVRDASYRRQVLVTTHSGDLLDAGDLAPSELFAVRSEAGGTHVGPLDVGGRLALDESLFSAGELLRTDQLQPAPDSLS